MLCMYNHVLKAVYTETQHEAFMGKLYAHCGPVSNAAISTGSAVQQTLTTLKGCRAMIVG